MEPGVWLFDQRHVGCVFFRMATESMDFRAEVIHRHENHLVRRRSGEEVVIDPELRHCTRLSGAVSGGGADGEGTGGTDTPSQKQEN